jgi:ABC-2 type transport system permease protein
MTTTWRAEVRKLRSTRSLWAIPVVGALLSVIGAGLFISLLPVDELASRVSEHGPLRFGPSNTGLLLAILAVRIVGDEDHHGTLSATYIATPDRRRVAVAKAGVAIATTIAFCVSVLTAVLVVTLVGIEVRDLPMAVDAGATAALFARTTLAMSLLALLGVALATAIRDRTVALVSLLVWLILLEDLLGSVLKIPELLPGAAVQALVSAEAGPEALAAAPAAAVLAAFVAATLAVAAVTVRRDVT